MNCELAKELKDAGFPQVNHDEDDFYHETFGEDISNPTLSELIEACGDKFASLSKGMFPNQWMCLGGTLEGNLKTGGDTPEEAVARLWLALNKHE